MSCVEGRGDRRCVRVICLERLEKCVEGDGWKNRFSGVVECLCVGWITFLLSRYGEIVGEIRDKGRSVRISNAVSFTMEGTLGGLGTIFTIITAGGARVNGIEENGTMIRARCLC
jgi:hypothetical protein